MGVSWDGVSLAEEIGPPGPPGPPGTDISPITSGTAIVDFGTGMTMEAIANVTGQTGILSTSHVRAWIRGGLTADNTETDHMQAGMNLTITASSPTPGVGFNIAARSMRYIPFGSFVVQWAWNN